MSKFSLFVERVHYSGASTRAHQRTLPVNALSDTIALREAEDFVDGLFVLHTIRRIRAHLCRDDGTVLREITGSRDDQIHGPGSM
jgi:hypothetical protein